MSSQRERRAQKKREKQRKQRTTARKERGSRAGPEAPRSTPLSTAAAWPIDTAWISQDWHEKGVRVTAVFTRQDDGRFAAAVIEVDLAAERIESCTMLLGVPEGAVQNELVQRSGGRAMAECDPELVVRLIQDASVRSLSTPPGWERVEAFVDGIAVPEHVPGFDWGPPEATPKKTGGVLGRVLGRILGS